MSAAVLGELPALPLHTAGKYVAAAYIVLFLIVLIYVTIMAVRLRRTERHLAELLELTERPAPPAAEGSDELDVGRPHPASVGAPSE